MKLDNEQQREILLKIIEAGTFPGSVLKVINHLVDAIEKAEVEKK